MSTTTVNPPADQAQETPLGVAGYDLVIADGSSVHDQGIVVGLLTTAYDAFVEGVKVAKRLTNFHHRIARAEVLIAAECIGVNGYPSWNFGSMTDAAKSLIGVEGKDRIETSLRGRVLANLDQTSVTAILNASKQLRKRTYTEWAITSYVLANEFPTGSDARNALGELKWSEPVGPKDAPVSILLEVPTALKKPIAAHYSHCKLDVPEKFGGPAKPKKTNGTGAGNDQQKPSASVMAEQGLAAIAQLAAPLAVFDTLRSLSTIAAKLTTPEALSHGFEGKAVAVEQLKRCSRIVFLTVKLMEGEGKAEDIAELGSIVYDPNRDKLPTVA